MLAQLRNRNRYSFSEMKVIITTQLTLYVC